MSYILKDLKLPENMKVSGFTFIKNGSILGYPFIQSIQSILPIVDEFIVNVGASEDDTLERIRGIKDKKIKIITSDWNNCMTDKGYVYGQQKMIAQFNCSGDWAFYIEGDEIYHENDLERIRQSMLENLNDPKVEALAFKFKHFYGNTSTYLDSPGWYRKEVRIIRNNIRSYAPDGLFWVVLQKNKKGRYPFAKLIEAECYHYGWVRTQEEMNLKSLKVNKYWSKPPSKIDYSKIDPVILKLFNKSHPKIIKDFFPISSDKFQSDPNYLITKKDKKYRLLLKIEKHLKLDLSRKHFKLLR